LYVQFSPVDARVLHYGMATKDTIEQIKGVRYSLPEFLGKASPIDDKLGSYPKPGDNVDPKEKRLYYCLLYLAPGDYHGIHSPTNWTIESARHFPGKNPQQDLLFAKS
jgi:phosphatidylserine decarboxylase